MFEDTSTIRGGTDRLREVIGDRHRWHAVRGRMHEELDGDLPPKPRLRRGRPSGRQHRRAATHTIGTGTDGIGNLR